METRETDSDVWVLSPELPFDSWIWEVQTVVSLFQVPRPTVLSHLARRDSDPRTPRGRGTQTVLLRMSVLRVDFCLGDLGGPLSVL